MSAQQPGQQSNAMWPLSAPVFLEPEPSSPNCSHTSSQPAATAIAAGLHDQHAQDAVPLPAMEIPKFLHLSSAAGTRATTTIWRLSRRLAHLSIAFRKIRRKLSLVSKSLPMLLSRVHRIRRSSLPTIRRVQKSWFKKPQHAIAPFLDFPF